jgi:hypothetical protein
MVELQDVNEELMNVNHNKIKNFKSIEIMDNFKKLCFIDIIPTEDKTAPIVLGENLIINIPGYIRGTHFHVYILTEIKQSNDVSTGDWIYNKLDGIPIKFDGDKSGGFPYGYQKILLTTNKTLVDNLIDGNVSLPGIDKSIVDLFLEKLNYYGENPRNKMVYVEFQEDLSFGSDPAYYGKPAHIVSVDIANNGMLEFVPINEEKYTIEEICKVFRTIDIHYTKEFLSELFNKNLAL